MSGRNYSASLEKARAELEALKSQRTVIDGRIARLETTVRALAALLNQPIEQPVVGLTQGIRNELRRIEGNGLYPTTVRARLREAGVPLPLKNPMASIHTVLKRLAADGYIEARFVNGKRAYFWVSDTPN